MSTVRYYDLLINRWLGTLLLLQMFLSSASLLHPLIFISQKKKKEPLLTSSHLSSGLFTGLLPRNFLFNTFFGILVLPILTISWAYCEILNLIHFTVSGPSNNSCSSCLYLIAYVDDGLKYSVLTWSGPTVQRRVLRDRRTVPHEKVEKCVDNAEDCAKIISTL